MFFNFEVIYVALVLSSLDRLAVAHCALLRGPAPKEAAKRAECCDPRRELGESRRAVLGWVSVLPGMPIGLEDQWSEGLLGRVQDCLLLIAT